MVQKISKEDKEKIYLEEKARLEARDKIFKENAKLKTERELKSLKKTTKGCLWVFLFIAIIVVVIAIINPEESDVSTKISHRTEPLEYQLAVINKGGYVAEDDITVVRFKYLLESLDTKTIESKQQISDMLVVGQKLLREKYGIEANLLELTEGVDNYILPGSKVEFARKNTEFIQFIKLRGY